MLSHWSVLNWLSASSFTANLPSPSSLRKILVEAFLHIKGGLYFYSFSFVHVFMIITVLNAF